MVLTGGQPLLLLLLWYLLFKPDGNRWITRGYCVGSFIGLRDRAIGDVFVSAKEGEVAVRRTQYILRDLRSDARVASFSPRYSARAEIITEDDVYMVTNANEQRKSVNTTVLGVNPDARVAYHKLARQFT